jgi:hypothetical protein
MRTAALALLVTVVVATRLCGQQRKTCLMVLDNADRQMTTNSLLPGNTIVDVAGNVRIHCDKQKVSLRTDSLSMLSGDYARLYGHAVYQDSSYQFAADTIIYLTRTEKVEGRGHVVALDKTTGSTLVGPFVDYWRQVKGINDSAKVIALLRPTVRYFVRATPKDTAREQPYLLSGQMLQGFGGSRLWGSGSVTVDRDSLHGTGDSLAFQRGATSVAQLIGAPARLRRNGTDSFTVTGGEIRLGLADDKLRDLHAFGGARVTRGSSVITGDTVVLSFAAEKLSLTLAWGKKSGATLHSSGYDVRGDSLAVESPGELLRELRVKHGTIFNPRDTSAVARMPAPADSTKPDTTRNFLSGNRLLAHFDQADSAGTVITRLKGLESFGRAASYFARTVVKNGKTTPSINYTLADTIFVLMKTGDSTGVSSVRAYGHVYGAQLETASLRKKGDSTRVTVPGARP